MSIVCIIPARGGSKRIPRKNIKPFAGLPMIAHSIRAAQQAGLFDRILVSTDDDEIMTVAKQYGAEAPFRRPAELADDFAGTDPVLQHALAWLADHGTTVEYFCCLYPTAPFVRPEFLRTGLDILRREQAASAFTVTTFAYPIFRALRLNDRGRVEMFWPENFAKRSQDFPQAYHDAGQFYWFDARKYLVEKRLFTSDSVPVILPRHCVQDIDTPEDWEMAEKLYRLLHG